MDEEDFFSDGAEDDFREPNYTVEEIGTRTSGTEVRLTDSAQELMPEQILIFSLNQALFTREHVAIWPSSRQHIAGRLILVKQDGVVFLAWQPNCRSLKKGKLSLLMFSYR